MIANFTNEEQSVKLPPQSNLKNARILDTDTIEKYMANPDLLLARMPIEIEREISLKAFGLYFID